MGGAVLVTNKNIRGFFFNLFDRKRAPLKWVIKDLNRETSIESFIQIGTIVFVIIGFWFFVFSKTISLIIFDELGVPSDFIGTPQLYDSIVMVFDIALQSWRIIEKSGLFAEPALNGQLADLFPKNSGTPFDIKILTYFGLSIVAALVVSVFGKLVGLLLMSIISIGLFRIIFSIPIIVISIYFGTVGCRDLATGFAISYSNSLLSSAIPSQVEIPVSCGLIGSAPVLASKEVNSRWFSARRVVNDKEEDFEGIILICQQNKCLYLPAERHNCPLGENKKGYTYHTWDITKGVGVIPVDDNILHFRFFGSSNIPRRPVISGTGFQFGNIENQEIIGRERVSPQNIMEELRK